MSPLKRGHGSEQECTSCPPTDTTQAHAPALLSTEQAATSPYSSTPAVASARDAQLMAAPVRACMCVK